MSLAFLFKHTVLNFTAITTTSIITKSKEIVSMTYCMDDVSDSLLRKSSSNSLSGLVVPTLVVAVDASVVVVIGRSL